MEISQCKRSIDADEENNPEMIYMKRLEQSTADGAQSPHLARHNLRTPECTLHLQSNEEISEEIEVGSVYEIDHTALPPRTPVQLRSIRVVKASEKTELNVTVRFPSIQSLRTYFSNRNRDVNPELDEKFVMGRKLAGKLLFRQVSAEEFAEKKPLEGFWLVDSPPVCGFGDVFSNKGTCFSALKGSGMVQWGVRRQVRFIGKHRENHPESSSSFIKGRDLKVKEEGQEEEEEEQEQEDDEREVEEEAVTEDANETKKSCKRKQISLKHVQKSKRAKVYPRQNKTRTKNKYCKQIALVRSPKDRWSKERYKLAEQNLLEVMKAKGAKYGNPILRPELRAEARKRIGDTGLLDHLLKHMAGKVAPGGTERFRRRHNPEGAMEYWLESADLANIRKDAGVQDPYWSPPPGWKPGDCPTRDPICARELDQMKEETSKIERHMEDMVSKKQLEEEIAKLRREMEEVLSKKQQEGSQAIVISNPCATSEMLDLDTSLVPQESDPDSLLVPLGKYKEQLMVISNFVCGMEEEIRKLTSKAVEEGSTRRSNTALIVSTESLAEKEKKQLVEEKGKAEGEERGGDDHDHDQKKAHYTIIDELAAEKAAAAEEKAAKIQRLKSGFRICKPQGTFLWPNMVQNNNINNQNNMLSPQVVVQVEDLFMVPTPPSVSSSTASNPPQLPYHHHHHNPPSPVKPLAERRAVTVTVSTNISTAPKYYCDQVGNTTSAYTTGKTTTTTTSSNNNKKTKTLINLNDLPTNLEDGFCGTQT